MAEIAQIELLGMDRGDLAALADSLGEPAYRGQQLLEAVYRQRVERVDEITTLSQALRIKLADRGITLGIPRSEQRFVSVDGTVRYLIAFADGQSVETVWMPEGDGGEAEDFAENSSLSTSGAKARSEEQSIAAMKRNLTAGEIVGQVLAVLKDQQVSPQHDRINLVFMGMGEPFLNYDNFIKAVRLLVQEV